MDPPPESRAASPTARPQLKRCLELPDSSPKSPKLLKSEQSAAPDRTGSQGVAMNPSPRVQRYLVAIEYIGTRFSGSQKQLNCRTVVGVLEEAFQKFVGQPVSVFCSSRTDAGVHALSNVCHVDVERISKRKPGEVLPPHDPGVVQRAVNHFLQKNEGDMMVIDVRCIPADFHARYKAQERTYFYRLLSGPEPISTFDKERAWHIPEELDILSMQEACRVLVGQHDFSSFRASGCQANSPVRTLDELHVSEIGTSMYFPSSLERQQTFPCEQVPPLCSISQETKLSLKSSCATESKLAGIDIGSGQEFGQRRRHRCYVITARARSFLYHQVRLLVGVLKCVGTGELTVNDVEKILKARTVTASKPMAPACGLYLGQIRTEEMDLIAERGIAAHYSGRGSVDNLVGHIPASGRKSRGKTACLNNAGIALRCSFKVERNFCTNICRPDKTATQITQE